MAFRFLVGSLLVSAFALAGCSSPSSDGGAEVGIHDFTYEPASVTVKAGEHVHFANHDSVEHSVTPDSGGFTGTDVEGGGEAEVHFETAGTFAYHCKYHASMHGTVVVQ